MMMRTLTGMLAVLMMAVPVNPHDKVRRKSLFSLCVEVLSKADAEALRGEFHGALPEATSCRRLTNSLFVVFNGGGAPGTPFHYCDLRRVPACEAEPLWVRSLVVEREFRGVNGEHFMLWKASGHRSAVYDQGYGIASLAPKSASSRIFDVYSLAGGSLFRSEDPSNPDPCKDPDDVALEVTGYELLGEGTADVELRFSERIVNCKSSNESRRIARYRLRNSRFELVD